jgi:hypothetical protein
MNHVIRHSLIIAVILSATVIGLVGSTYVSQQQLTFALNNITGNKTASSSNTTSDSNSTGTISGVRG